MKKVVIVMLIFALVSVGIFVLYLQFSGQIQFIPERFAEEFLKFLANLISIVFGFYLVNVYWEAKGKQDKQNQVKRVILNYLLRVNRICLKIIELLSVKYSEAELEHSRTRDAEIASLVSKLERLASGLESFSFDPSTLGDPVIQKIFVEIIREGLLSDMDVLMNQQNYKKTVDVFVISIRSIEKHSSEGIGYLTGSKKVEA